MTPEARTKIQKIAQRRRIARVLREKALLPSAAQSSSARVKLARIEAVRWADRALRENDPLQQVVQHLRRRGYVVYNCAVDGGNPRWWQVDRREPMTPGQLREFALQRGFRGLTGELVHE